MNSNDILKSDVLDILFENRNKAYGAYVLRKYYNNRLSIALALMLSFILFLSLLALNPDKRDSAWLPQKKNLKLTQVDLSPLRPEVIKPRPTQPARQVAREKLTKFSIREDEEVKETVADQEDLRRAAVSSVKAEGVFTNYLAPREEPRLTAAVMPVTVRPSVPVNRDPEFPGGKNAWADFLKKNLSAPADLEAGEQKTALIRFEVATDGTVTGFVVVRSAGRIFDEEVIRVLKKMPRWKPAIQNGEPVASWFTQPVTFMGLGE